MWFTLLPLALATVDAPPVTGVVNPSDVVVSVGVEEYLRCGEASAPCACVPFDERDAEAFVNASVSALAISQGDRQCHLVRSPMGPELVATLRAEVGGGTATVRDPIPEVIGYAAFPADQSEYPEDNVTSWPADETLDLSSAQTFTLNQDMDPLLLESPVRLDIDVAGVRAPTPPWRRRVRP